MPRPSSYRLDALLRLVRLTANTDAVEQLHAAIEREIAVSSRRIDRARAKRDEEYLGVVVDDECDHIEELLGMAFVAAQTFIMRFRSRIAWASGVLQQEFKTALSFFNASKPNEVLARGNPVRVNSAHTEIETINAVANYWKHQEDWPTTEEARGGRIGTVWDVKSPTLRRYGRTIEVVISIGMTPGCTGNLRTAAEVLGVTDYADLAHIRDKLSAWAEDLSEATRLEISKHRNRNS
jgi:hypothetical protein